MKKSTKKLKLHRETLNALDASALAEAVGAITEQCVSSPLKCFLTGFQNTCER